MGKNIFSLDDFKGKKSIQKSDDKIKESKINNVNEMAGALIGMAIGAGIVGSALGGGFSLANIKELQQKLDNKQMTPEDLTKLQKFLVYVGQKTGISKSAKETATTDTNTNTTTNQTKVSESKRINEMVEAIDDVYRVSVDIDLPKSLIGTYIKKVKDQTGKDLRADMGEKRLAERLVQWTNENYLNIENLPVEIVTGSDKVPIQSAQSQVQSQPEGQTQPTEGQAQPTQGQAQPTQGQAQVQVKPQGQSQGQVQVQPSQGQAQGGVQNQAAQTAAAQIPAQEI